MRQFCKNFMYFQSSRMCWRRTGHFSLPDVEWRRETRRAEGECFASSLLPFYFGYVISVLFWFLSKYRSIFNVRQPSTSHAIATDHVTFIASKGKVLNTSTNKRVRANPLKPSDISVSDLYS